MSRRPSWLYQPATVLLFSMVSIGGSSGILHWAILERLPMFTGLAVSLLVLNGILVAAALCGLIAEGEASVVDDDDMATTS